MTLRPPRPPRTDTLVPYTTRFRSAAVSTRTPAADFRQGLRTAGRWRAHRVGTLAGMAAANRRALALGLLARSAMSRATPTGPCVGDPIARQWWDHRRSRLSEPAL